MPDKKLKIALTGGIGTGKSVVADLFAEKGYTVLFADKIAKEILNTDKTVKEKIIEKFGKDSYKDGIPNIKYLSEKVFANPANVEKINEIVHTPTIERIKHEMETALKKRNIVFVEAALIFEAKMDNLFDYIILVTSDQKNQIERVKARNKLSEKEILKRIENQLPENIKKAKSDFIIENNGSLGDLKTKAEFVLNILEKITGT